MDEADENLDVVNDKDEVIGAVRRGDIRELFATPGRYIRYANCFLRNTDGKLWIPRRVKTKTIAPNGFDFSSSEHVKAGEDYESAAVRGLAEELAITADISSLQFVGKLQPDLSRPYFSSVFVLTRDTVPDFNTDDFSGYEWLTITELKARLDGGEIAKDDLAPALRFLA